MSAAGLHRLMGARFHHAHAECSRCTYYCKTVKGEWVGWCTKLARVLCCGRVRRCRLFVAAAPDHADPHVFPILAAPK